MSTRLSAIYLGFLISTYETMRNRKKRISRDRIMIAYIALFAILVFGISLSLLLYTGPYLNYDDQFYISSAHMLLQGEHFLYSKFSYGFLKTALLALSFKILGYGSIQAALPNLAYFIIIIYLAFLVGKHLQGYALGLLSAFLAAGMPFLIENATRVLSDVPLGMAVALFFYIIVKYADEESRKKHSTAYFALAAGLAASLSIYFKTEGFIIIFAEGLAILALYVVGKLHHGKTRGSNRVNTPFLAYSIIGLVIGLLIYFTVFYIFTSNPFFSIENYGGAAAPTGINKLYTIELLLNPNTFASINIGHIQSTSLGLFPILSLIGTAIGLKKHNMKVLSISVFFWFVFVYLFFGPASTTHFIMVPTVTRLFDALAVPFAVLSAYGIITLYMMGVAASRHRTRVLIVGAALVLLALVLLTDIPLYHVDKVYTKSIHEVNSMYKAVDVELLSLSNGTNLTTYINGSIGFRQVEYNSMQFVSSYSPAESFFVTNSVDKSIVVPQCPVLTPLSNDYLLDFTGAIMPTNTSMLGNYIQSWLGSNCTAVLQYRYAENKTYYSYMYLQAAYVYRIEPANSIK